MSWFEHHYSLRCNDFLQEKVGDKYGVMVNEEFEVFEGDPSYDDIAIVVNLYRVPTTPWQNDVGAEILRWDSVWNPKEIADKVEAAVKTYLDENPDVKESCKQYIK